MMSDPAFDQQIHAAFNAGLDAWVTGVRKHLAKRSTEEVTGDLVIAFLDPRSGENRESLAILAAAAIVKLAEHD